ncbi:unnamed protein product [Pedinophyceae sp. YPF-701]|nr:unnamed protein product [Pedinophyceae sp. YPF-701]
MLAGMEGRPRRVLAGLPRLKASKPAGLFSRRRRSFVILGIAIICYFIARSIKYSRLDIAGFPLHRDAVRYPEARNAVVERTSGRFNMPGVGIVTVCLDRFARQTKCEALVETVRDVGGWGGEVFVITDASSEQCFRHKRWRDCELDATIIPVDVDTPHWTMPSLSNTKGVRSVSKTFKMRIFEIVGQVDPSIEALLFMDGDVLIGEPMCLESFFKSHVPRLGPDATFFAFREEPPPSIKPHGGIFLVHKEHSAHTLSAWMHHYVTSGEASDQTAFVQGELAGNITGLTFMDTERLQSSPECRGDDECARQRMTCFVHLHNARCVKYGAASVQRYVQRWGLCTMQDMQYCTPMSMAPFAMGWVPYNSCQKMEFGVSPL